MDAERNHCYRQYNLKIFTKTNIKVANLQSVTNCLNVMTPKELLIVRICCAILFAFASLVKLVFWRNARITNPNTKSLLYYYFKWHNMYSLYDTDFADIRDFLKTNNFTNRVIWISIILFIFSFFVNSIFGS